LQGLLNPNSRRRTNEWLAQTWRRKRMNERRPIGLTVPYREVGYKEKKGWVGLTGKEIDQGLVRSNHVMKMAQAWRDGVEWAEQQLKEKNDIPK
jgi:hypothetical protein